MSHRLLLTVLLVLHAAAAHAFVTFECDGRPMKWATDNVKMRVDPAAFPPGAEFDAALAGLVQRLAGNPSKVKISLATGSSVTNEISASADEDLMDGAIGKTFLEFDCLPNPMFPVAAIVGADVFFNATTEWAPGTQKIAMRMYGGTGYGGYSFDAVAFHELGHALGLQHETDTYSVMLSVAHHHTNGSQAVAYLGEDSSNGLVALYGLDSPRRQDIAVSHWRFVDDEAAGLFGHFRTPIYYSPPVTGSVFEGIAYLAQAGDWWWGWREPRYLVYNGQTVFPQFTLENNGATSQTVKLGFFLSTDDTIDTSDTRFGGVESLTLARNTVLTVAFPVTLPDNLVEGTEYALGVIVDESGAVAEGTRESNNATYTHVRIGAMAPASLSFNPSIVPVGGSTIATLTLRGPAPAAGVTVSLAGDSPYVTLPATVTVPGGATSATFNVATSSPSSATLTSHIQAYRPSIPGVADGYLTLLGRVAKLNPPFEERFFLWETFCLRMPASPACGAPITPWKPPVAPR